MALHRTVEELLAGISARELTEWEAYERAVGPLDHAYGDDMLASIHEAVQFLCRLTGAQLKKNPAKDLPRKLKRPHEVFLGVGDNSGNASLEKRR